MYSVLLGYGYLEIVSPESVREEMKRRIDNLRLHYEKH